MPSSFTNIPCRTRSGAISIVLGLSLACGGGGEKKASPPASVSNAVAEADLTSITLSVEAVRRLGIETATVESTTVAPSLTTAGEVLVPPGGSSTITAPVAGIVMAPPGGPIPRAGSRVRAQQPILRLVALPPDRDILRSRQDLTAAEAQLRQAQAEAARVAALYADRLVSARDDERARADLATARAARDAAAGQSALVQRGVPADASGLSPLLIVAPSGGVMQQVTAGVGQSVAAGAVLALVTRAEGLWVRIPIYAGEANRVSRRSTVSVHALGGPSYGPVATGVPVTAPPTADAASASVDLYYQVAGGAFRPGERVGVTLPLLNGAERLLVVPLASVVRDMNGGSWVYERTAPTKFVRRRVEIARIAGVRAVLARGPAPGTVVVTSGAAELFGTEFGAGK
jgi:RND family efflux transporter MFP subunit